MRTSDMSNISLIMWGRGELHQYTSQFIGYCRDFLNIVVCCYLNIHFVTNFMVGSFNVAPKCMIVNSDNLERQAMHAF
jgi:hypothetical protein